MDCVRCRETINRYIDEELTDPQVVEFQQHLSFCPECAAELEGLAAARTVLRATREVTADVPAGFADRVMDAVDALPEPTWLERKLAEVTGGVLPGRLPRRLRHYAYYGGLIAAAVAIGWQQLHKSDHEEAKA